jgi:hypothetical protein
MRVGTKKQTGPRRLLDSLSTSPARDAGRLEARLIQTRLVVGTSCAAATRTFCQPSIPDPVHYSTPVPPSLAAKASPADGVSAPLSRGPDPRRLAAAHHRSPLPLCGRTSALHRLPPLAPPHRGRRRRYGLRPAPPAHHRRDRGVRHRASALQARGAAHPLSSSAIQGVLLTPCPSRSLLFD